MPQEPFLFSDTLADNVAFGLDAIEGREGNEGQDGWRGPEGQERREGREGQVGQEGQEGQEGREHSRDERQRRIEAAAAVARLDKDVADFPKGYETMVGERGITLSGGQKQRTAIARAIVIDPRILILDDALSAVDTYTEEEILSRLRRVMRQRTSIIVSHRISTVRDADQIFVLDEGRIVERGTHDELIQRRRPVRGAAQEAVAGGGAGGVVGVQSSRQQVGGAASAGRRSVQYCPRVLSVLCGRSVSEHSRTTTKSSARPTTPADAAAARLSAAVLAAGRWSRSWPSWSALARHWRSRT